MGTEHREEEWNGILGAQREEGTTQNIYTVLSYSSGKIDKGHEYIYNLMEAGTQMPVSRKIVTLNSINNHRTANENTCDKIFWFMELTKKSNTERCLGSREMSTHRHGAPRKMGMTLLRV